MRTEPSLSRPVTLFPWLILLAAVLLAAVLAASTVTGLRHDRALMEESLRREGLTLIRTFEAGARNSLIRRSQLELDGLVQEAFHQGLMAYVVIVNPERQVSTSAGAWEGPIDALPVAEALEPGVVLGRYTRDAAGRRVLEIGTRFDPLRPPPGGRGMPGRRFAERFGPQPVVPNLAIFVGLYTEAFDRDRQALVLRSALQGGGLLLLGSAGLVILFLAQRNRVAASTLRTMELYTRNIIDSLPDGLLSLDAAGRVMASNDRTAALLGLAAPPVGQTLTELLGEAGATLGERLARGETVTDQPLEARRPDGTALPLKATATPLADRDGHPLGTVLTLRDLREIRAMEEQLERSRRHAALGQMAAGIAHEIRNPLGTLRGFAEYFAELRGQDPAAGEYADLMIEEVDRLGRNVSALLQYARPREPEQRDLDGAALLQKALRLTEAEAAARQVALDLALPDPPPPLRADADLLLQVLLNLLQNAIAACREGDRITLGLAGGEGETRLTVADTGEGMTEEVRARMFDPFFTTRKTGTGLGLAVVHQIVEQHGGRITVDSTPGQGTTVCIHLPLTRGDA